MLFRNHEKKVTNQLNLEIVPTYFPSQLCMIKLTNIYYIGM